MTNAQHLFHQPLAADAGRHFARLHDVLTLIRQIAGHPAPAIETELDRSAKASGAYGSMSPVAQRRFDTLVAETSSWAVSGFDTLASIKDPRRQPRAAAARLADELERALADMNGLLRLQAE
jgi:hypothetical protein